MRHTTFSQVQYMQVFQHNAGYYIKTSSSTGVRLNGNSDNCEWRSFAVNEQVKTDPSYRAVLKIKEPNSPEPYQEGRRFSSLPIGTNFDFMNITWRKIDDNRAIEVTVDRHDPIRTFGNTNPIVKVWTL